MEFLNRLGTNFERRTLSAFWPNRGPVWDGLACSGEKLLPIEAKAHVREMNSSPSSAGPKSLAQIKDTLEDTKTLLKVKPDTDWARCFYQYTNCLAHLYLLRELNELDANLGRYAGECRGDSLGLSLAESSARQRVAPRLQPAVERQTPPRGQVAL